jgi:alkanesulfonate monooxygenase SsuD/methylene tetrahydromethanopterin reductase-like flavin-dependent oxidoreductase (luciferase family)
MAATFDVVSNGRLEFGIGAGWFEPEFKAYGISFPKPRVRIAQLQEALELTKNLWTKNTTTFRGKYYSLDEAFCNPKPIQKPHPPIWIGIMMRGKRMLETIARYADGWAISSLYLPSPEEYVKRNKELEA